MLVLKEFEENKKINNTSIPKDKDTKYVFFFFRKSR